MLHETGLISTITVALAFAFVGGFIATRFHLPAIVGYLLAGVAVGPFTPGFIADTHLAPQLAEIGVILLMFGVGIHFSLRDLLAVRSVAIPGAVGPKPGSDRPDDWRRAVVGVDAQRRAGARAGDLGGQHRRAAPRAHGPRPAGHEPGPRGGRLAN